MPDDLEGEIDLLQASLEDAIEEAEDMLGYVSEFFQEKWEYQETIKRLKADLDTSIKRQSLRLEAEGEKNA